MSVTRASLIALYPEFADTPTTQVDGAILAAQGRLDARILGDEYDQAVTLQACHLLAISPYGQQARLVAKDGSTTYETSLGRLLRMRAGGPWVIGWRP